MQLLFFSDIKTLTGYTDNRSVKTFLGELRVPVLRIGRNNAVDKAVFEAQMEKRYRVQQRSKTYIPKEKTAIAFATELHDLLSKEN
ncbi:MAG: hypothetical protein MUC87_18045 [Bacteroidia bacterium]|jgi:hypothetical protein|nr:hypothetical protein [Bacteroidia bacterium]